jgi:hypothetical protein
MEYVHVSDEPGVRMPWGFVWDVLLLFVLLKSLCRKLLLVVTICLGNGFTTHQLVFYLLEALCKACEKGMHSAPSPWP